jgi:urocanate reductase
MSVQAKLELLEYRTLDLTHMKDGAYTGTSLGYCGDVEATVTVRGGQIANIEIEHREDIDQGATRIIPQRIVAVQSLAVDAITGATATTDAVIGATFLALKQAGLGAGPAGSPETGGE